MSAFLISLIMSIGISAWIYSKVMERTGGNTQNALIVSGVSSVMIFVVTLVVLGIIDSVLN